MMVPKGEPCGPDCYLLLPEFAHERDDPTVPLTPRYATTTTTPRGSPSKKSPKKSDATAAAPKKVVLTLY